MFIFPTNLACQSNQSKQCREVRPGLQVMRGDFKPASPWQSSYIPKPADPPPHFWQIDHQ